MRRPTPPRARGELCRTAKTQDSPREKCHPGHNNLTKEGLEHLQTSGFQLEGYGKPQRQQGECTMGFRKALKVSSLRSPGSHLELRGTHCLIFRVPSQLKATSTHWSAPNNYEFKFSPCFRDVNGGTSRERPDL